MYKAAARNAQARLSRDATPKPIWNAKKRLREIRRQERVELARKRRLAGLRHRCALIIRDCLKRHHRLPGDLPPWLVEEIAVSGIDQWLLRHLRKPRSAN